MVTKERATGIDVSHYKKLIDWIEVKKSGVQFAIIKATESDNFVDPRFDYNWSRTRRQGLIRGAYHFFRPLVDPVRQANNFIKIAGRILHQTDLPPVLDIESYPDFVAREWKQISLDERLRRLQIWLKAVESATGRTPIIYTNYYAWRDYLGNTEKFARHPLWIAAYKVDSPKIPANNWGGKGWTFWQTSERGIVPGIRGEAPCVDMDVYRGTFEDLNSWLKIDQARALPPEVTNGDMMAALIDTADLLEISSDDLVNRAGLEYLVDPIGNSLRPYDGPAVQDLPLSKREKKKLSRMLDKFIGANSVSWCITHQDLINAFYSVGSLDGTGGWTLVERAGLNYIGEDRSALYNGPVIEMLPGLTEEQKSALSESLGLVMPQVADDPAEVEDQIETPVEEVEEEPAEVDDQIEIPVEDVEEEPVDVIPVEEDSAEEDEPENGLEPLDPVDEAELEIPPETVPSDSTATYGTKFDNQAMINAFYLTAIKLDLSGRDLIGSAGLSHLLDSRMEIYTGPRIELLPNLSRIQRETIAELLGIHLDESLMPVEVELVEEEQVLPEGELSVPVVSGVEEFPSPQEEVVSSGNGTGLDEDVVVVSDPTYPSIGPVITPTYPGLVNQDLINLFYRVAALFGENGWHWIVKCGLAAIGASRKTRFEDYKGPYIKSIPGLTKDQKDLLERELNQLKFA